MPPSIQSTDEQRHAFGAAIVRQMDGQGIKPKDVVEQLAAAGIKADASSVSNWRTGKTEPPRSTVLALEEVLGMKRGSLARTLGWLPADAVPALTVHQAVAAEPRLTPRERRMVLRYYDDVFGDR